MKTISEAKEVTGELKYQPTFNFVVRTIPVLLCNNVPSLADLSHGMLRRLMVIPFERRFTDEDRDPDLFARIWGRELPGVLNRALRGYRRVLRIPSSNGPRPSRLRPKHGCSRQTPSRPLLKRIVFGSREAGA